MPEKRIVESGPGPDAAFALAAIVDSPVAAIVGKSLNGIVTSWNREAERIFLYAASEMIGRPIATLAAPGRGDEMAAILTRIRDGERVEIETERRRKDGRIIEVALTVTPIRDDNGRIIGASKIARDITAQRRAERTLKTTAEKVGELSHALDLAPAMVRGLDGRIIFWGKGLEALYGYAAAAAMGRNCHDLLATEFPAPLAAIEDELLRRGTWHGELHNRARDGGAIVAESHWVLHRDSAGAPVSVLEFDRDLTEQRRSERRLLELQGEISHMSRLSEMGQMASALAHEINQPLTAATNYVTAARRLLASDDAAQRARGVGAIDSAAAQVTRAGEIVRRLRSFVQKAEGAQQREDMTQVIAEASALALIGVREQGVKVQIRVAPGIGEAVVDKIQIQQVLVNLIRNAVEAMAGGARRELAIGAQPAADAMVEVSVADTGPGIAPDVAARLFQPFVTSKPQGMGVGLSICRTIVEAHGGRLWAEARERGGTVFRFTVLAAAVR